MAKGEAVGEVEEEEAAEEGEEEGEEEVEEGDEASLRRRLTPTANSRARSRSRLRRWQPLPLQSVVRNVSDRALCARPRRRPTAVHAAARVTVARRASVSTARARPVRLWLRRTRARRR